jgi:hypothetical protein
MKMKQFLIRKPSERKKFAAMMTQHLLERDGVCIALTLDESTGNFVVACSPEPSKTQQAQLRPAFASGQITARAKFWSAAVLCPFSAFASIANAIVCA